MPWFHSTICICSILGLQRYDCQEMVRCWGTLKALNSSFRRVYVAWYWGAYNRFDKGSWLLPLSLVPFLGPALYLVLRPSLSTMPVTLGRTTSEPKWYSHFLCWYHLCGDFVTVWRKKNRQPKMDENNLIAKILKCHYSCALNCSVPVARWRVIFLMQTAGYAYERTKNGCQKLVSF